MTRTNGGEELQMVSILYTYISVKKKLDYLSRRSVYIENFPVARVKIIWAFTFWPTGPKVNTTALIENWGRAQDFDGLGYHSPVSLSCNRFPPIKRGLSLSILVADLVVFMCSVISVLNALCSSILFHSWRILISGVRHTSLHIVCKRFGKEHIVTYQQINVTKFYHLFYVGFPQKRCLDIVFQTPLKYIID